MLNHRACNACLAALLIAGMAGCGKSGSSEPQAGTSAPATTPTTTSRPTATTPAGIDTLPGAGTSPVVAAATNRTTALLKHVRVARHEGFDRVVFEFDRALPGYDVRYVQRPVRQDGSGKVVAVAGDQVVVVRAKNALDADLTRPGAPRTYTGPLRFSPTTPEVAELVRIGGFEGVLSWAVGLHDRVDYRVSTLKSPPRLIVDFRNH